MNTDDFNQDEFGGKRDLLTRAVTRLFFRVPQYLKTEFRKKRVETNINRMFILSIFIIVLQVLLNVINIVLPSPGSSEEGSAINIYVILSMATLLLGILYLVLTILVKREKIKNKYFIYFISESLVYFYVVIQLVFCTLNIMNNAGFNSFIIAILIVGIVPIMPPLQGIVTVLGSLIYTLVIAFTLSPIVGGGNSIMVTETWTNMIIITGIAMVGSVMLYDMYTSNFLSRLSLERSNVELEATVRKRTRELEKQTHAAVVASNAKSDFLARMSHEIRTPLNAIIGMAIIASKTADEKTKASIEEISTASNHLLGILNDILDMSKIESGKYELSCEDFNLQTAVTEVSDIIQMRCNEKKVEFKTEIIGSIDCGISGDKLRLKQVLINLLGNAVKFTPEYGKVSLKIVSDVRDTEISVYFSVIDNGIGIAATQLDGLFRPFVQADKTIATNYGGTGLGLVISKNLVMSMGGDIAVESELGKGSKFSFELTFPRADLKTDQQPTEVVVPDLSGRHILLAEDIEVNRIIVHSLIEESGVEIDDAVDGLEAVDKFAQSSEGYYDLIFMDVQMPNMDGHVAAMEIRKLDRPDAKTVPIVAMTANAYKEDVDKALAVGMNGLVAKPISTEKIYEAITENMK